MNNLILPSASGATMTSQQIADLVGSRHDSVKRSIERLAAQRNLKDNPVIQLPPLVEVKNHLGQTVEEYVFSGDQGERDSYVVVAQLSPEFTAHLVDEWKRIKGNGVPQTYSEALQLAADQAKQLELAAPKVRFYDDIVDRKTLMTATQVASKHKMSAQAINKFLDEAGGVYNQAVKRGRVFTTAWVTKGYGEVKQTEQGYSQSLFTPLGEARVHEMLISEGAI